MTTSSDGPSDKKHADIKKAVKTAGIDISYTPTSGIYSTPFSGSGSGVFYPSGVLSAGGSIVYASGSYPLTLGLTNRASELEEEINQLRSRVREQTKSLETHKADAAEYKKAATKLESSLKTLQQKEELAFLLSRVSPRAQECLLADETLRKRFFDNQECQAFVISVDIRRSTELMLKARKPELFSRFISVLCERLDSIVKENFGVFDKFTGDGVLAFFPDFFSGEDAGFYAINAAQQCQEAFGVCYKEFRTSFSTVLTDVGLGIGVDFGSVHLLRMGGGITVVGGPVVYACRLGGAPAGHTYLNQPAFEKVVDRYGGHCYADEAELDIKHEGKILCYDVRLSKRDFKPKLPDWVKA